MAEDDKPEELKTFCVFDINPIILAETYNISFEDFLTWINFRGMMNNPFIIEEVKTASPFDQIWMAGIYVLREKKRRPDEILSEYDKFFSWEKHEIGGMTVVKWTDNIISISIEDLATEFHNKDILIEENYGLPNLINQIKMSFETAPINRVKAICDDESKQINIEDELNKYSQKYHSYKRGPYGATEDRFERIQKLHCENPELTQRKVAEIIQRGDDGGIPDINITDKIVKNLWRTTNNKWIEEKV